MIGILVAGHGHFATGIRSTVELILGEQENFVAVDFPEGDTKTELEVNINEALQELSEMEHILIFCDIISGSPFNVSLMKTMDDSRVKIFYGTNLGMLVNTAMNRNMGDSWEELISDIIETGQSGVGTFESPENAKEQEDEDWD